jgi:carbonic anhydrase/acetyltransferase-like protein (isoleucine patch superfamily)
MCCHVDVRCAVGDMCCHVVVRCTVGDTCVVMLMSGILLETQLSASETQGKLFAQSSTDAYIRQVGNL